MADIDNIAYDLLERPIDEQQLIEYFRMMDDWKAQRYMDEINRIDCPLKSTITSSGASFWKYAVRFCIL